MSTIVNMIDEDVDYRKVYREIDNLGDDEGQNKAPDIDFSSPGWTNPDSDKVEQLIKTDIKTLPKVAELKKSYDFKTKNKSFLELYRDLHSLGIKNNKFFLVIYDRSLIGVDPFSEALPLSTKLRIIVECMRNPWYWLREICRVPQDGSAIEPGGGSEFIIDRTSAAAWYCFINHIDHYLCKPRQTGKTHCALSEIDYAYTFGAKSATVLFANKDGENNKMNLYRLKCHRDMLPRYMQMKTTIDMAGNLIKEKNSVTTIRNPVNNNNIKLLPRANSKDSAMTCGRGATASLMYFDEWDFIPYQVEIMNSAAFAYSRASENAAKSGSLYIRLYSSTPGDLDSRDGAAATEWLSHTLKWEEKFYDVPIEKLRAMVNDNQSKRNGVMWIEHSWKQLKKTQAWYETQCRLVGWNLETIAREIDLKRLHGSSLSPFKREDIMYIQANKRTPIGEIDLSKNMCPFKFYKKMKKSVPYFICIDPSEGLALDNNAIEIESPYTLEVVCEMKNPYISQPDLSDMLVRFMDLFCPNALLIIENNKGRELINCLRKTKYANRIWYDTGKMLDVSEKLNKYGMQARDALERRAYGLSTTNASRAVMMGILERMMDEEKRKFVSEYVVDDISALIRTPSGKIQAAQGQHDDNIMAYLFGPYIKFNSNNLEEFGIDVHDIDPDEESLMGNIRQVPEENKPLTEEDQILKLREMYPDLPTDIQALLKDNLFGMKGVRLKSEQEERKSSVQQMKLQQTASQFIKDETVDDYKRLIASSTRQRSPSEVDYNYDYDGGVSSDDVMMDGAQTDRFYDRMFDSIGDYEDQNPNTFDLNDYI